MPLPAHLHKLMTQSQPAMVKLSTDDLFQLAAYLKFPDKMIISMSRQREEVIHGITTYSKEIYSHEEFHLYLRRIQAYNESLQSASPNGLPAQKSRRGRVPDTDPKADEQIFNSWQSRAYKKHSDLATALNITLKEVRRALDRHRKRVRDEE
jgi:hypothetical protein